MRIKLSLCLLCLGFAVALPPGFTADSFAATASKTTATTKSKTKISPSKKITTTKSKSVSKSTRKKVLAKKYVPPVDKSAYLVVDANSGRVLYEKNAGSPRYPASLTKMMTLYMLFEAIKKGDIRMDQTLPVSKKAAAQPQTNISLREGDRLPVKTVIESLVVRSANDSAMVVAEALGETQWNFALMMTKKGRQLGMKNTVFKNPNGLPDNGQHTTAYDMARLAIALRRDFPEQYHYFSLPEFSYNGVTYPTHNRVIERYPGADGVKTGYIRASGFNVVTSVKRGGFNIVGVVMGGATANGRDDAMIDMLDRTFAQLESKSQGVARKEEQEKSDMGGIESAHNDSVNLVQGF
jgi:D-alanyl-D-alanine carboxypeptidase